MSADDSWLDAAAGPIVRPYAIIGGRTQAADSTLELVAMVVVTEWVQYRTLDLERLKREVAQPVVVDLRNIYRPEDMAALGFVSGVSSRKARRFGCMGTMRSRSVLSEPVGTSSSPPVPRSK